MEFFRLMTWGLMCGLLGTALVAAPSCFGQTQSSLNADAAIVAAPLATADGQKAVADLAEYVHQSIGVRLPVEQASVDGRFEIHVGQTDYVRSLNLPAGELEGDAFRIFRAAPDRLVLIGGSDRGTEFAIYEFLERFVGVRWLFPGEHGTHVPKATALALPAADITSRPAYISRTISNALGGHPGEPVYVWLQRHRRHWTIQHHHNLNKLISPDEFYESRPEFFPLIDGKREKPEPEGYYWQPVLHAPGIVEASIGKISKYFEQNPQEPSYSLGINDNNNFENAPDGGMNSVELLDYSDYFFNYANAVVEGVLKKHPDKWFGCLAYVGITDPPKKSGVHPRIVPYICIDRHGWASEQHAQRDMQRTRDWHAAAPTLGWYDYIYGDDMYRIPRIYNHLMARYLKFGVENGVKAMYAEYYGSPDAWIDGPKLYVFMKLLWDPGADVDAIQDEWYRLAVGDKAAEPLARYYAFWEDYWMTRVPRTDWFGQYADRVYFDFTAAGYLDELTKQDLEQCRQWMDQVVALAQTSEQKARAAFFAAGFAGILRDVEYVVASQGGADPPAGKRIIDDLFAPAQGAPVDEKVPAPWSGWQHAPGTARFYWDHEQGQTDAHALAIYAANAGFHAGFFRDVPIEKPAEMYHLRAAVQCTQVNDNSYVGIAVQWTKPDGSYLPRKYDGNRYYSGRVLKDGQWTPLSFPVRRPPVDGPLNVQVSMKIIGGEKGTVRFDNLVLTEVE